MTWNLLDLTGRILLVTGAASGIGRETAILASRLGARIIVTDRNQPLLEETLGLLEGHDHQAVAADLTVPDEMAGLVSTLPALDGVAHCAGIIKLFPHKLFNEGRFDQILDNNYKGPVLLQARLWKASLLRQGASVVFVSSMMSVIGTELNGLYAGTKGALVAMARCLALELAPKGIRVNCVSPGFVQTPMLDQIATMTDITPFEAMHPLGFGTAEDVANSIVFLLSPASRWMTGANLILDGGYSVQ